MNAREASILSRALQPLLLLLRFALIVGFISYAWAQDETSSASYEARKKRLEEARKNRPEPTTEQTIICDGGVVLLGIRSDSVLAISNFPETSKLRQSWDENTRAIESAMKPCQPLFAKRSELNTKIYKNATSANLGLALFLRSESVKKLEEVEKQLDACMENTTVEQLYSMQAVIQAEAARQVAEICD